MRQSTTRAAILLVVAMIGGVPVWGADQSVTIRLAWTDSQPAEVAVTLHARDVTGSAKPLEIAVNSNDSLIPLSAGQWFVSASSAGYWSAPTLISVADQPVEATLMLYRSTRLRGRVTIPSPGKATAVDVHFNPTEVASGQPRGSVTCPVSDGQLDCELPAGSYDLALRIPGHASLYRWAVDLRAKPSVDVGKFVFRRGATLSGQVEVDSGPLDDVEVTLRNATASERNDALRDRQSVTRMVTRPNKRGFFAFDVLPGSYIVSAKSKDLVSEERQVTVIEGREAILKEPLILERLWTLIVNAQLPPEGAGMPWKVVVRRFDSDGNPSAEQVVRVPSDGVCRFEKQLSGSYGVELRIRDSVWATQSIFLGGDTTLDMSVRITKVRGTIQLGEKPLQAELLFVSPEKGFRIPARSRADGKFLVFLPGETDLPLEEVEIQSTQPWLKRVLKDVPLERDDEGVAALHLRLPETRIDGVVVDERARPIKDGMINITASDGFRQFEMSDGTFTIHGLEPGRYVLTAATAERETEEPLVVEIAEGELQRDVVLKVAPISQIDGSVASALGPVIGASVFIDPVNHPHPIIGTIPVDNTGAFTFRVPPQTRDIVVGLTAPGFSFRMMRMPVPPAKLDLVVDQNGGVLTIDGRVGARAEPRRPYLIHNGAILGGYAVAYLAGGRLLANADERVHFEIPSAEEGTYGLCLLSREEERSVRMGAPLPQSRCVSGVLGRHGALTLRAPEVSRD